MSMGEVSGASFTLGSAFRPESVDDDTVAQMVKVLDLQDAAPSIERLRSWALAAADVRRGDTCVDVGSGTGTVTRRLARLAGPDARVVGVEPNGMLREVGETRARESAVHVQFCQGLATELPLDDASVDVVWCERVLQHVPDAQAAIVEIARVLRPGGRALLVDTDHSSRIVSDIEPKVARRMLESFMGQVANPRAARHIPRQAMAAGLSIDPDVGSTALVFSPDQLVSSPLLHLSAEQAVADGAVSREQADEAMASVDESARQGWAFAAVTMFAFVCRKD
jgi:ubiquinone/menaquinone biosynthesis C-methylase UbiE